MREVQELIERVADTDVTVLIRGESGTGKELVARALYASSPRRDKPFVKVNCAALPTELLESELFGFERGAFTGAIQHKPGKFEFANTGTIFLDEIGDMSCPLQAKLLQVLQDGEFARLGGKQDIRVDVRVIAATNHDLAKARRRRTVSRRPLLPPERRLRSSCRRCASGATRFRLLTEYFLRKYSVALQQVAFRGVAGHHAAVHGVRLARQHPRAREPRQARRRARHRVARFGRKSPTRFRAARDAADAIPPARRSATPPCRRRAAGPPVLARAAAVAPGVPSAPAPADADTLAAAAVITATRRSRTSPGIAAREAEKVLILRMLQQTRWNRKETAQILGISYKALLYKIKDAGLDKAPTP